MLKNNRLSQYILKISRPMPIGFIENIIGIYAIILAFTGPGILLGYMENRDSMYTISMDITKIFSVAVLSVLSVVYLVLFILDITEQLYLKYH